MSLTLVAEVAAEPRRRVAGALQAVVQIITVGVHVPDLRPGRRSLP